MLTEKQKEAVERYRRIFPKNCEGKDDIAILRFRNLITAREEEILRAPKVKKVKAPRLKKEPVKKVRPYTQKQVEKMCKSAAEDFKADMPELNIEDAAYDMAYNLLFGDERMVAYWERTQVRKEHWVEALADYFV